MARDMDDYTSWVLLVLGGLLGLLLIVALAIVIAGEVLTTSDKRACRAAGHVVVTSGDEWHCSGALLERTP